MKKLLTLALVTAFFIPSAGSQTAAGGQKSPSNPPDNRTDGPRRIIIDTDPGTDDAMALLLALNSPEVSVEAVTVVAGNVVAEQGLKNALKIMSLAGRCDIPAAKGSAGPLDQKLITCEFIHGANGLADMEPEAQSCQADRRSAPDLIIELVRRYPGEITIVTLGPLTNIALAVSKDPAIARIVKEVVVMGGSLSGGNSTAAAEANIYGDPEAAQIVFNAGWPLTMVGLDVANRTVFTRKHLDKLASARGPQNDFAAAVLEYLIKADEERFSGTGTPMFDPLAMGAAIDPTLIKTQDMRVDVETKGEFTRGETVANRYNTVERNVLKDGRYMMESLEPVRPNVKVSVGVDAKRFLRMFIKRLRGK